MFLREISVDWDGIPADSYLRKIPALVSLRQLCFHRPVTFFTGENGSGKSTLLEAIAVACGFNPEGGSRNYCFSTYDTHSELCRSLGLVKGSRAAKWGYFLRAESFYNVATAEEAYSRYARRGSEEYHKRSHGESFLHLVQQNFTGDSLYLLDEPEAALSPQRQLTLLLELRRCVRAGAQFLIASHSPILLGMPDAELLCFDGGRIHPCTYEETGSYRVTEMFVRRREQLLRQLFAGE
ncbi:MAG: AAA family ATPase [Oscillospiraceae bacterium]|nr:AAA family ATPase [Oscillospiraceae bacterium]MCR5306687.1 AAA family ATPase [Oscillospiraceae bacterium]